MVRELLWTHVEAPGLEYLRLLADAGGPQAHGTIVGVKDGHPFSLSYLLRCDPGWHVRSLRAECRSGDTLATIDLEADGQGNWRTASQPLSSLLGCLDLDLEVTAFTNTLPVRRLALAPGASAEILVAYVTVPRLSVEPMGQRYTRLSAAAGEDVYRYETVGSDFRADLRVDPDGLVIDYPDLFRRVVLR